jgi:acetolactate synthase regulatory subunit
MKTHTNAFKNGIKTLGRQLAIKITYGNTTLDNENINSANLNYKGDILKSVMKQLELDSNVDIPLETQITAQIGLLVGNQYEYLNYGTFIVNKSEKQENTNSYILTCYDKMLLAMTPYEDLELIYPVTIRNYLGAICTKLGITFANASDTFTNYNKEIQAELYLDSDGNSLEYTYRDVLDELAEVTASTICINDQGNLEVRYINNTNDTIDEEYLKNVNVKFGELYGPINTITISRSADSDSISLSNPVDLPDEDKKEIKISDNQILNNNDRDQYIAGILDELYGLAYYTNDYASTGILYYDLCDKYNVSIDNTTYSCVMLNDEINLSNGLTENVHTELPEDSKTDYTKTDKTDRRINQTTLIVDKQNGTINALVNRVSDAEDDIVIINANADSISARVTSVQTQADSSSNAISTLTNQVNVLQDSTSLEINAIETALENGVESVKNSLVTIDSNGIKTAKDNETFNTQITNKTFEVKDRDKELAFIGYDTTLNKTIARIPELEARQITAGVHRCETITRNGNKRTAWFYVGGGN